MTERLQERKRASLLVRLPEVEGVSLEGGIDVEQLALFSGNGRLEHYWFDAPKRKISRTVTRGAAHGHEVTTTIATVDREPPTPDMSIWADSAYLRLR